MSDAVIQVDRLGKKFRRGAAPAYGRFSELLVNGARAGAAWVRDRAVGWFSSANASAPDLGDHEFWALKDVSFEVRRGEVLGIIGRNGAGKSTLLKLLSRITRPTVGEIRLRGRIGSLLEVGTGFHPELTGRENVYLNGTILGMRNREIDRKFDEIVAFAEIDQFLDTPVKHYSSGMYMRLAFAVAAHLDPEILLVDEVLAVGDAQFQKKCLGKMGEVAHGGRSILFVSHNLQAVSSLCRRAVLLDCGRVVEDGPARTVVERYLVDGAREDCSIEWPLAEAPRGASTRLHAIRVVDAHGQTCYHHRIDASIGVEIDFWLLRPGPRVNTSIHVHNQEGICLFALANLHQPETIDVVNQPGLYRASCRIPGSFLNEGRHWVSAYVVEDLGRSDARCQQAVSFCVDDIGDARGGYCGQWIGAMRPIWPWTLHFLGAT